MPADFKAIYDDLSTMAKTFHDQATDWRKLHSDVAPPVASGGDAGLDHTLKEVADLIIGLHLGLADRLDDHGTRSDTHGTPSTGTTSTSVGCFDDLDLGEG